MTDEEKVQKVKEVLFKYCEPKPEYDGMSAHEIATLILKSL